MAAINLVAICLLSPLVVKLTRDCFEQGRLKTPIFDPAKYPELNGRIDAEICHEAARVLSFGRKSEARPGLTSPPLVGNKAGGIPLPQLDISLLTLVPRSPQKFNFVPCAARHNKAGGGTTSMSRGGDENAAQ